MLRNYESVVRVLDCRTRRELERVVSAVLGDFGASAWIYAFEMNPPGAYRDWMGDYPLPWVMHYQEMGYPDVDPTVLHVARHSMPFLWPDYDKLPHDAKALELPENRIFIEAHEFALNGGITIPLHRGVKWALLSLSFASFAESVEANRRLVELFFIAHNVHETALRVMTTPPPNPDGIELTAIEYECLRLAADGLPTPEMSVRLGRPVRAVTLVFESLFKKLGVRTRAAAVAYALRKGLIDA